MPELHRSDENRRTERGDHEDVQVGDVVRDDEIVPPVCMVLPLTAVHDADGEHTEHKAREERQGPRAQAAFCRSSHRQDNDAQGDERVDKDDAEDG